MKAIEKLKQQLDSTPEPPCTGCSLRSTCKRKMTCCAAWRIYEVMEAPSYARREDEVSWLKGKQLRRIKGMSSPELTACIS